VLLGYVDWLLGFMIDTMGFLLPELLKTLLRYCKRDLRSLLSALVNIVG
jgi:hypothetical protein